MIKNIADKLNSQLRSAWTYLPFRTKINKTKTITKSNIGNKSAQWLAKCRLVANCSFFDKTKNNEKAKTIVNKRTNVLATILLMV